MRACLLVLLLCSAVLATTVRLRSGSLLSGEITSHDEKGFTLHRPADGGEVTVAWTQLDPEEAKRVQDLLRLPEEKEELLIDGSRVTLDDGSSIEGKIVEDKPDLVVIKTQTGNRQLPRGRVRKVETVQIPALSFCTAEELYQQQLKGLDTKDAKAEFALGQFCIRVKLYDRAKEHLQAALALDASLKPEVDKRLSVVDRVGKEAEAQKLKDDALAALAAQKFDDALADAQKLASDYAGTAAGKDAADLVKKIQDEQGQFATNKDKFVGSKVVDAWYDQMDSLIRKAATNKLLKLADAKTYIEKTIVTETKNNLATQLKMTPEAIETAFRSRQPSDAKSASYGEGTWVIDNLQKRKGNEAQTADETAERAKNDPIIDAEQKKLPDAAKDPEAWWSKATTQVKMNWLRAYNAERNLQVTDVKYEACVTCKGKGLLGGSSLCKRCLGIRMDRVVSYK